MRTSNLLPEECRQEIQERLELAIKKVESMPVGQYTIEAEIETLVWVLHNAQGG